MSEFVVSKKHPKLLKEIKKSLTATDQLKMFYLARCYLEPLRAYIGAPIKILSGKRSESLNRAVKGSPNSDHLYLNECAALDFTCAGVDKVADYMQRLGTGYGQLIWYPDQLFIHLSLASKKHFEEKLVSKNGTYQRI